MPRRRMPKFSKLPKNFFFIPVIIAIILLVILVVVFSRGTYVLANKKCIEELQMMKILYQKWKDHL